MKQGRVFILQTTDPACLIEAVCLNDVDGQPDYIGNLDDVFDLFTYINPDGAQERWELIIKKYFDTSPEHDESLVHNYRHALKRAWKWYLSYLKFEDEIIDRDRDNDITGMLN